MNLPDPPPAFRKPTPAERPWWWRFEDAGGNEMDVAGQLGEQRFASQADAESWVGETWAELAEQGVEAVSLYELDRLVYGPMSLRA